jgi:hypothetical protein
MSTTVIGSSLTTAEENIQLTRRKVATGPTMVVKSSTQLEDILRSSLMITLESDDSANFLMDSLNFILLVSFPYLIPIYDRTHSRSQSFSLIDRSRMDFKRLPIKITPGFRGIPGRKISENIDVGYFELNLFHA